MNIPMKGMDMKPLGNSMEHYWRVIGMANAVGVDLAEARDSGALSEDLWADMVQLCRKCQWEDGCSKFLETPHTDQMAPFNCLNAVRFEALKL